MKRQTFMLLLAIVITAGLISFPSGINYMLISDADAAHDEHAAEAGHGAHDELPGEVPFDRPVKEIVGSLAPMTELEMFPCTDCHDEDWETDYERRELSEPHDEIPGKFVNHDTDNRWCLDCHSATKRDNLKLINGKLIKFNEYYRVCEQCHKRVYREWKMGVHGKRTGYWNGEKEHMHCTQCHDPHNPPFKVIKPMPVPRKPLEIRESDPSAEHSASADTHH